MVTRREFATGVLGSLLGATAALRYIAQDMFSLLPVIEAAPKAVPTYHWTKVGDVVTERYTGLGDARMRTQMSVAHTQNLVIYYGEHFGLLFEESRATCNEDGTWELLRRWRTKEATWVKQNETVVKAARPRLGI